MVPAAVARDIGSDIQRPLATVIIGGLLSTLGLTLLALPAVYWLAATVRRKPKQDDDCGDRGVQAALGAPAGVNSSE